MNSDDERAEFATDGTDAAAQVPDRETLELEYLETLKYTPYEFQSKAIEAWFKSDEGVLVCAPTGMGKTLVAEAGLYEALRTGKRAYYTTPLIALTEQKYAELQESAERWGFSRSDVGLVTGNRRENVDAKVLVVVAEILFNRLLASDSFERFAKLNESKQVVPVAATAKNDDGTPKISAASLNAKKSVAITADEAAGRAPLPQQEERPAAQKLPEIPVDESDFEEDGDGELSNLHFSFDDVGVVVMDEFHQFNDPERGVVWEFSLGLLPPHVRTLLISATVGNAAEFSAWLRTTTGRTLTVVQATERRVTLVPNWVGDQLLADQLELMARGAEEERFTPALVFCFNRDECWDVAEVAKGRNLIDEERKKLILEELEKYDLSAGAGPKLRHLLQRGVGVHHAGILPKYRRIVENLFQQKLLAICVCTETLAAGINLPARSVVLPTINKGPRDDRKLIEPSSAHQIFGRAGRPQYDTQGYVFAMAPEFDVKYARKLRELDSAIPPDTRDPRLLAERKKRLKKLPKRGTGEDHWTEKQFMQLWGSKPARLYSRGALPWRVLAHMIECNSDVRPVRTLVARRLMSERRLEVMQRSLDQMLLTLWRGGFVRLAPNPERYGIPATAEAQAALAEKRRDLKEKERKRRPFGAGIFDDSALGEDATDEAFDLAKFESAQTSLIDGTLDGFDFYGGKDLFDLGADSDVGFGAPSAPDDFVQPAQEQKSAKPVFDFSTVTNEIRDQIASTYRAQRAYPTSKMKILTTLRGVNPIYGAFLLEQLGLADRAERIQAFESLLEMPAAVARCLRVPRQSELPPGALATSRLDQQLLQFGLATVDELVEKTEEELMEERENRRHFGGWAEERVFVLSFAEKLRLLYDYQFPAAQTRVAPVWAAGELLLDYKGDFAKFIQSKNLQRQEGVVFRHLLRLILLLDEFIPLTPRDGSRAEWRADLLDVAQQLVAACRRVDPSSVEETLRSSGKPDLIDKT